jgi:hypothetical protein
MPGPDPVSALPLTLVRLGWPRCVCARSSAVGRSPLARSGRDSGLVGGSPSRTRRERGVSCQRPRSRRGFEQWVWSFTESPDPARRQHHEAACGASSDSGAEERSAVLAADRELHEGDPQACPGGGPRGGSGPAGDGWGRPYGCATTACLAAGTAVLSAPPRRPARAALAGAGRRRWRRGRRRAGALRPARAGRRAVRRQAVR